MIHRIRGEVWKIMQMKLNKLLKTPEAVYDYYTAALPDSVKALAKSSFEPRNAKSDDDNVVYVNGPIDDIDWAALYGGKVPGTTARGVRNELNRIGRSEDVIVEINSPGGYVFEGVEIYNILKTHKGNVEVRITGLAASIAQLVAMAGDHIIMGAGTMQFVHSPWTMAIGDCDDFLKIAEDLELMQLQSVEIVAERSGMKQSDVDEYFRNDTLFTAKQCVELGLADERISAKNSKSMYNAPLKNENDVNFISIVKNLREATDALRC